MKKVLLVFIINFSSGLVAGLGKIYSLFFLPNIVCSDMECNINMGNAPNESNDIIYNQNSNGGIIVSDLHPNYKIKWITPGVKYITLYYKGWSSLGCYK